MSKPTNAYKIISNPHDLEISPNPDNPKYVVGPADQKDLNFWVKRFTALDRHFAVVEFTSGRKNKGLWIYADNSVLWEEPC